MIVTGFAVDKLDLPSIILIRLYLPYLILIPFFRCNLDKSTSKFGVNVIVEEVVNIAFIGNEVANTRGDYLPHNFPFFLPFIL